MKGVRKMLTKKQEDFVQGILNGMSQREAYRNAYSAENMSENAIDREASLLLKNPKVAQRFSELRKEMAKPTIMTAQQRLEFLTNVINGEEDMVHKLKALDLMNKMQGEYVQKIDANVNADIDICIELTDED